MPRARAHGRPPPLLSDMSRLYNRETLAVVLLGFVIVLLLGLLADLGRIVLFFVAAWLVTCLPVAMKIQHAILPVYLSLGFNQRALDLAVDIRDSAPNRKKRDLASLDIAMVQASMGRLKPALKTLEGIKDGAFKERVRALIIANRSWCRSHLKQDLKRALEEAREARGLDPEEGLLAYFEGLALHKNGRNAEARAKIEASLEAEADPKLPAPGERALILGDVLAATGEPEEARESWLRAKRQAKGKGPFSAVIEERVAGSKP